MCILLLAGNCYPKWCIYIDINIKLSKVEGYMLPVRIKGSK